MMMSVSTTVQLNIAKKKRRSKKRKNPKSQLQIILGRRMTLRKNCPRKKKKNEEGMIRNGGR